MNEILGKVIWDVLEHNNISFAMVYSVSGSILWYKGKEINGDNLQSGSGFCTELIYETLKNPGILKYPGKSVNLLKSHPVELHSPGIKCIVILHLLSNYFLYLESKKKRHFTPADVDLMVRLTKTWLETTQFERKIIAGISGDSELIKDVQTRVITYAMEEELILLLGETGVGKNHVASIIHQLSGRKGKLVVVNTPSIPENLFESQVFGHRKGAFTDAHTHQVGLVEYAENGTLFFDEIAVVPNSFQAKLLQFLDTKKYRVLGDPEEKEADVRIIAASNCDLELEVTQKRFRKDLYYRINILPIEIPPLRERKEDIIAIIKEESHLLRDKKIDDGFWDEMLNHHWPGNIRELINVLKRLGINLKEQITWEDIKKVINNNKGKPKKRNPGETFIDYIFEELYEGKTFWEVVKKPFLNRDFNREEVRAIINRALEECGGKYKNALELFGIEENDYKSFMRFLYDNDLR
jgi:transcriptional regulator with PAS, ATPase and Fis domain